MAFATDAIDHFQKVFVMKINHAKEEISIVKASGEITTYSPEKLKRSLTRAGASDEQVQSILQKIEDWLYPGITTKKIYQYAFKLLRTQSRPLAARYKLKSAIMELGPSGFPFEKYIAAILGQEGYQTKTGVFVEGHCVKHEVDIVAEMGDHHFMIECKYHNRPGTVCDVKIPLYIQSRFKDVESSWVELPGHNIKVHQGWVVTNTRFTTDAVQYGTCIGLFLLGWNYPVKNSLNQRIERLKLYPITCLTSITKREKELLLSNHVVLCKEICDNPSLLNEAGVAEKNITRVLTEANLLCDKN